MTDKNPLIELIGRTAARSDLSTADELRYPAVVSPQNLSMTARNL